jgi:hypothetical protein
MVTQKDLVESCLVKYRWEQIPEGEWFEEAHYPDPKSKSSATVLLWRRDHCAQGVLQSEELGYPCIFGDEKPFLEKFYPELLPLWEKWVGILRGLGGKTGGKSSYNKQVGIFSPDFKHDPKDLSNWGSLGIQKTLSYSYECPSCGMRNNPGNIAKHIKSPRNNCSGKPIKFT